MKEEIKDPYDDLDEVMRLERNRIGERSGLHFMITQQEYQGTWKL